MKRRAFTLVELLVVVAIVALLIAILLPALNKARETAQEVACLSNTRQMSYGYRMFADDNRGMLPIVPVPLASQPTYGTYFSTYENIYLEQALSPYLVKMDWGTYGVGGGPWTCPASPLRVSDRPGKRIYERTDLSDTITSTNAYSGKYWHFRAFQKGGLRQVWNIGYFSRPTGVPTQYCSTSRWKEISGSGRPRGHHGPSHRPSGFLDGHSAVLTRPEYAGSAYNDNYLYSSNKPYHAYFSTGPSGYESAGDFALSDY